jgi:hypothetical protein
MPRGYWVAVFFKEEIKQKFFCWQIFYFGHEEGRGFQFSIWTKSENARVLKHIFLPRCANLCSTLVYLFLFLWWWHFRRFVIFTIFGKCIKLTNDSIILKKQQVNTTLPNIAKLQNCQSFWQLVVSSWLAEIGREIESR